MIRKQTTAVADAAPTITSRRSNMSDNFPIGHCSTKPPMITAPMNCAV